MCKENVKKNEMGKGKDKKREINKENKKIRNQTFSYDSKKKVIWTLSNFM